MSGCRQSEAALVVEGNVVDICCVGMALNGELQAYLGYFFGMVAECEEVSANGFDTVDV